MRIRRGEVGGGWEGDGCGGGEWRVDVVKVSIPICVDRVLASEQNSGKAYRGSCLIEIVMV